MKLPVISSHHPSADTAGMEILVRAFGRMAHFQIGREAEPEPDVEAEEVVEEAAAADVIVDAVAEPELAEPAMQSPASGFQRSTL